MAKPTTTFASEALAHYMKLVGSCEVDAVSDLIADLGHLWDEDQPDGGETSFEEQVERGLFHYNFEKEDQ